MNYVINKYNINTGYVPINIDSYVKIVSLFFFLFTVPI